MEIRPAALGDARRIAEIHVRAWKIGYRGLMPDSVLDGISIGEREAFWRERLRAGKATVLVASEQGRIAGWLVFGPSRDDGAEDHEREIYGLYVDPQDWRKSCGTQLWREAHRLLESARTTRVVLWVLQANQRARRFYESVGFVLEEGHIKTVNREGTALPEVRYGRSL